jgi:hypothetical protein
MTELETLRFPVGRFTLPERALTGDERSSAIDGVAAAPAALRAAVAGLGPGQLATRYRPDGWTVRQVVHHVPDSHLNAYIRFRWTLTEDRPAIKTYDQSAWARLPDSDDPDIEVSLDLLDALHGRWVRMLRRITDDDWARTLLHPEWGELRLDAMLELYAWHGRHHVAHVTTLREREGW